VAETEQKLDLTTNYVLWSTLTGREKPTTIWYCKHFHLTSSYLFSANWIFDHFYYFDFIMAGISHCFIDNFITNNKNDQFWSIYNDITKVDVEFVFQTGSIECLYIIKLSSVETGICQIYKMISLWIHLQYEYNFPKCCICNMAETTMLHLATGIDCRWWNNLHLYKSWIN
jgi:hypothetical protein